MSSVVISAHLLVLFVLGFGILPERTCLLDLDKPVLRSEYTITPVHAGHELPSSHRVEIVSNILTHHPFDNRFRYIVLFFKDPHRPVGRTS